MGISNNPLIRAEWQQLKTHDVTLMFKMLVLQALYNLSDDQTESQVRDRLSFRRFLGLSPEDTVPDA